MFPALLLVIVALLLAIPAPASASLSFCGPAERSCARLSVPLDRSGKVPGEISLQVEQRFAKTPVRPPLFVLAGGPGQGATFSFDNETLDRLLGPERRNRSVVVLDQRGTGDSGVLECPEAQRQALGDSSEAAVMCANRLGPRRAFYTTRDSVADIEAVRQRLGMPRIALYGASYGTKVAVAYALAHPTHVERMVLDSVVPTDGPDSLNRKTIGAVPGVLRSLCGRSCRRFTRDPVADLSRLSARLALAPLRGFVVDGRGRPRRAVLHNADLLTLIVQGDLDPLLRAATPGLIRSAVKGDSAPILRTLRRVTAQFQDVPPKFLSAGTYAAAICEEEQFPWPRTSPVAAHGGLMDAYVRAQPATAFWPFARDVTRASDAQLCRRWPQAAKAPALRRGGVPDVPVLLLAGTQDTRTPLADAQKVAATFRRGTLIAVRGIGHDVLGQSGSGCPVRAVQRFFAGAATAACPAESTGRVSPPAAVSIRKVRRARGVPGRRGRTLTAVRLTVSDATEDFITKLITIIGQADDLFNLNVGTIRGGGLRAGHYAVKGERYVFRGLTYIPGITVSGRLRATEQNRFNGRLRIGGRAAARGRLRVRGTRVTGRLGGRRIRVRLKVTPFPTEALFARASAASRRRPLIP